MEADPRAFSDLVDCGTPNQEIIEARRRYSDALKSAAEQ